MFSGLHCVSLAGVQARFPALYKASHPPPPPPAFDSSAEALHLKLPGAREAPLGIYGGTPFACLLDSLLFLFVSVTALIRVRCI